MDTNDSHFCVMFLILIIHSIFHIYHVFVVKYNSYLLQSSIWPTFKQIYTHFISTMYFHILIIVLIKKKSLSGLITICKDNNEGAAFASMKRKKKKGTILEANIGRHQEEVAKRPMNERY